MMHEFTTHRSVHRNCGRMERRAQATPQLASSGGRKTKFEHCLPIGDAEVNASPCRFAAPLRCVRGQSHWHGASSPPFSHPLAGEGRREGSSPRAQIRGGAPSLGIARRTRIPTPPRKLGEAKAVPHASPCPYVGGRVGRGSPGHRWRCPAISSRALGLARARRPLVTHCGKSALKSCANPPAEKRRFFTTGGLAAGFV